MIARTWQTAHGLRGYRIVSAPRVLRHFTAQFEPLDFVIPSVSEGSGRLEVPAAQIPRLRSE